MRPTSKKSKAKSTKKRWNTSGGPDGSGSGLPHDNAPGHMFGDNIAISGGQFTQAETVINNVNNSRGDPFVLLQQRVAPSAFHNSAQCVDSPRCHPDTRVAILNSIYNWIIHSEHREKWLLWLNGAAGAGKSAIMQSIAERCVLSAIAIASFFFFRADPTRNTTAPLIATLAYQLIQVIPETSNDILLTIKQNPLIFDQSIESQLQLLLIQPLLRLPKHLQRLFLVLIDGLDECNDRNHQSNLIKLFGTVSRDRNSPIVFLVSSRREPQIVAAFVDRQVFNLLRMLPLDNSDIEQTSEDIRHFLTNRFKGIKKTHLRRHLLPADWPEASAIKDIVTKSSGQFIYASVISNYVSSPRANPAHQLDVVRGLRLRDPSSCNPFAQLDALYQHIFSQAEALDKVLDILAFILITKESHVPWIAGAFQLESGDLEVYFADLIAVVTCKPGLTGFQFLHASLPDFLLDKTRSERYHIDIKEYIPKLLCMVLDKVPPKLDPLAPNLDAYNVYRIQSARVFAIQNLLTSGVKASDQLRRSFMTFHIEFYTHILGISSLVGYVCVILQHLKKLNFNDNGQAYNHVLDMFAAELSKHWSVLKSSDKEQMRKTPDLLARIS